MDGDAGNNDKENALDKKQQVWSLDEKKAGNNSRQTQRNHKKNDFTFETMREEAHFHSY